MNDKLHMICPNGHKIHMKFSSFKNGHRCAKCSGNKKLTIEEVKHYIESFEYKILSSEYINNSTKLDMQCPKGHSFKMRFNDFKNGQRCRECYNKFVGDSKRHSYDYVKNYIEMRGYELISKEYKNSKTKLVLKCPNGHIFEMTFEKFKSGNNCSVCKESKGERKICKILDNWEVVYKRQYRFNDCRSVRPLPFDFYLPDYNTCIEFDGRQHFNQIEFFDPNLEDFNKRKNNDYIKDIYCKNKNIKLIRIPYWEFDDIENILYEKLLKHVNTEIS